MAEVMTELGFQPRSNAHSQPGMVFVGIHVGTSDIPERGGAS
jgi:hypothetical protein